jgi:hypothetical protein
MIEAIKIAILMMILAYVVMSMPYEPSKKHSMMAAQCYAYNDETQQWDRLRNGQR